MKYISLFAGIGGFDLALNRLGHECVWANDFDKYAAQIYNKNFERCTTGWDGGLRIDTRDITTVPDEDIPSHDLLVGGFPCQAFSIAGKRRGFAETRGTLFFEIARILKAKQAKWFILENVKGLLSHDNGNTFKTIISTLDELGYDLQWQVLNSKDFGVPQNRERVFIVGNLRGERRPEVFPISESTEAHIIEITKQVSDAQRIYESEGIAKTLKGLGGGLGAKTGLYAIRRSEQRLKGKLTKRDIVPTLKASDSKRGDSETNITDGADVRRLTPVECERLQGFPDNWTEGLSDTQRYKCLGNAVTVPVVQAIAERFI